MSRMIEVDIDEHGRITAADPTEVIPPGRAFLAIEKPTATFPWDYLFPDWFTPEEDEAWAYLDKRAESPTT